MSTSGCGCGTSLCSIAPVQAQPIMGRLGTELNWRDVLGGWKVRWGFGRMGFRVAPGLYQIGGPTADSPVLVTANYKLTVDKVRKELAGLNAWLLVLDTNGVNVWCAAGKGTFGTAELVRRINSTNLKAVVNHRKLVVPQLGATGVAAHEVKRATGFAVHYGPVRAGDIQAYLAAGMKATPEMRLVTFNWRERIVLTPVELVGSVKWAAIALIVLAILQLVRQHRLTPHLAADFMPFVAAVITGGLVVPLLLPVLPFRAFALKGAFAGALVSALLVLAIPMRVLEASGVVLLVLAITSYMAMMFTGSTTFTTLAGAKLEVKRSLPAILASAAVGTALRVTAAFL